VREIKVRDANAGETTPNQRRLKLSDGVVENQSCMYTGNEPQPNMKQYCSIKVLEYSIHTADPINNPDKSILQVAKLEVVKTSEVKDSYILPFEKIQTRVLNSKTYSAKR